MERERVVSFLNKLLKNFNLENYTNVEWAHFVFRRDLGAAVELSEELKKSKMEKKISSLEKDRNFLPDVADTSEE